MIPQNLTWPDVAYALIITLPSIIAAIFGIRNHRALKTSNGKTIGNMVEETRNSVLPSQEGT